MPSTQIIGLLLSGIFFATIFAFWENRVKEPIIPLSLFKNDIFTVSVILSILSGLVMFAAFIFIPEYQQIVRGYSATKSGILMFPLVLGIMTAAISSGRLISKTGKYKMFPIIGGILTTIGVILFSNLSINTNQWILSIWMLILGLGMGMFMQIMVLAVQNSVNRSQLGTATATVTFARTIGSSFGTAIFGAIFTSRLTVYLHQNLPNSHLANSINVNNLSLLGSSKIANVPLSILYQYICIIRTIFP